MRFTQRDAHIIEDLYNFGGVMARRQLKSRHWPNATLRAMQRRISILVNHQWLNRPTKEQWQTKPIREPVYWLDLNGIGHVAGQNGITVDLPTAVSEYQIRKLAKNLHIRGIHWMREPRWISLPHDLRLVDFHLAIEKAVDEVPALVLESFIHENAFRSDGDTVEYRIEGRDGKVLRNEKKVLPDSYFSLVVMQPTAQGAFSRARFLLEMDCATHPFDRLFRDKIWPGIAYLKSPQYKERFGDNSGRWLVVTTVKNRVLNLKQRIEQMAGLEASVFWLTFFDRINDGNVLTDPVWWQCGSEEQKPLIEIV